MLNLNHIRKSHTAEHLKTMLLTCLSTWRLNTSTITKPAFFITDNGRNIVKAIESHENWSLIPCYAHCLQLAVKSAMKKCANYFDLRKKCREIFEFFSRSTSCREKFLEIQRTNNPEEEPLQLIQDVDTRWNSTHAMLQCLVQLRKPLSMALCDENMPQNLNNEEWKLADALVTGNQLLMG